MMKRWGCALAIAAGLGVAAFEPALAWTPPRVGNACDGLWRGGPPVFKVQGNYLGGRRIGHGYFRSSIVDYQSFQGCFKTVESCQVWLASRARHFPLTPGFATCTPVRLR